MSDDSATPLVAVITVTYDSEAHIDDLLRSLAADRQRGYRRRVYVVDNGSTDKTIEIVGKSKLKPETIARAANAGYGAACNLAALRAIEEGADFIALLNPDTRVEPGWLEPILKRFAERPDLACVQPRIMLSAEPHLANSTGNRIHFLGFGYTGGFRSPAGSDDPAPPCSYASGCACVFRAADYDAAGGFDPGFFLYHEDQDLGWRLRQRGREIEVEPRSVVYHDYRFERDGDKFYYLERNRWAFLLAHFRLRTLFLIAPALVAMEFGILFFCLRNGMLAHKLRAWRSLSRAGTRSWIRAKRNSVQKNRVRSDPELAGYLFARLDFGPLSSALFRRVVDPMLGLYWRIVRPLV